MERQGHLIDRAARAAPTCLGPRPVAFRAIPRRAPAGLLPLFRFSVHLDLEDGA